MSQMKIIVSNVEATDSIVIIIPGEIYTVEKVEQLKGRPSVLLWIVFH